MAQHFEKVQLANRPPYTRRTNRTPLNKYFQPGLMITFKFPEEKLYFQRFASELQSTLALSLLGESDINTAEQATELSQFFWEIVDSSIEAEKSNLLDEFPEGA